MNTNLSRRTLRHAGVMAASLLLGTIGAAQMIPSAVYWGEATSKEGFSSAYVGKAWVDGNEATFQRRFQVVDGYFGGVDTYHGKQDMGGNTTMTVDARLKYGNGDYKIVARLDNEAGYYLEGGWTRSRVFYDGGGGYSPLGDVYITLFDDRLHVDRSDFWIEAGMTKDNWSGSLRYDHITRKGEKDSTSWADTNLPGTTRNIVPTFLGLDEKRDVVTGDIKFDSESLTAAGGVRWESMKNDDTRNELRRPGESSQRYLTQRDVNDSDLFAAHAYVQSHQGDKLIFGGATSYTTIDTNLSGSRIYGSAGYDPVFDPAYAGRQNHDEGYYDLVGDGTWKEFLMSANALYMPANAWRLTGNVKYEHQRQDVAGAFIETAVGSSGSMSQTELDGMSNRHFNEWSLDTDLTYNGIANWVLGGNLELSNGTGDLGEDLLNVEENAVDVAQNTDFKRKHGKYGLSARWYPSTELDFATGIYRENQKNDYSSSVDSTPPTGGDRYPAYIKYQQFTTNDLFGRGTWRSGAGVAFTMRYDYQKTDIDSREEGLVEVRAGELTSNIIAGTITWTPVNSVVVQGTYNKCYDQVVAGTGNTPSPLAHYVGKFDNNYETATVLVIVAVDEKSDVQGNYTRYNADNFHAVQDLTQPYGMTATENTYAVTYNRRTSDNMVWSVRYAHGSYSELTSGGFRDFSVDLVYGRVQLRF